jgi:hypothetical protein
MKNPSLNVGMCEIYVGILLITALNVNDANKNKRKP